MLTAIILRSGVQDEKVWAECVKSLGRIAVGTVHADYDPVFSEFAPSTDYVLYIYDNERITPELYEALPTFFHCDQYDYLTLYRRCVGFPAVLPKMCPRIFRNHVVLKDDSLYPVDIRMYKGEIVLNGWLEEIE